jgi:hypothetical protein
MLLGVVDTDVMGGRLAASDLEEPASLISRYRRVVGVNGRVNLEITLRKVGGAGSRQTNLLS